MGAVGNAVSADRFRGHHTQLSTDEFSMTQLEVGAEGDALPSQASSAVPISLPTSPASPIEQMLGSALELHISSGLLNFAGWTKRLRRGMGGAASMADIGPGQLEAA